MKIDRRKFLAGLGACVGGGAVGTLFSPMPWKLMDDVAIWTQNWPWTPVPEDGPYAYVNSACALCPKGCGISVRKVRNRAVKIQGLQNHPVSQGRICPLGLSGLQYLYGPVRVKFPLKRAGKRGEGKWEPISWDAAISEISQKLTSLRGQDMAHTVAWISGERTSALGSLIERFLKVYGSPNLLREGCSQDALNLAAFYATGNSGNVVWDFEHADFILSFGAGLLSGCNAPVFAAGFMPQTATPKTLIQIEPRLSDTAAKANQWVPVKPGTEGVLALGIAHIIIRELLYQIDFVNDFTSGFEDKITETDKPFKGFKSIVLKKYHPGSVSEITGVPVDTLFDLARKYAQAKKPVAVWGRGQGQSAGCLDEARAVLALNALMGNIHQPGGLWIMDPPDYARFPDPILDTIAQQGLTRSFLAGQGSEAFPNSDRLAHRLPAMINTSKAETRVNVLFVSGANPLYTLPDTRAVLQCMEHIPFLVSFSPFMDETAAYADLVLPDHTYLESYRDMVTYGKDACTVISLAKPVVRPLYNTQHVGDVILTLARALGGSVASAFVWENYESLLKETLADYWETLAAEGFVKIAHPGSSESRHCFKTASQKFEFHFIGAGTENDVAPAFETVAMEGDAQKFPLLLIPYHSIRLAAYDLANPPFMTKTLDDIVLKKSDGFIEINPLTAKQLLLQEGDMVKLSTPKGEASVRVHLFEGVMPGIIGMPRGLGHTAYSEEWGLSGKGVHVNRLMGPVDDPSSGLDMAWGIRAKLTKI